MARFTQMKGVIKVLVEKREEGRAAGAGNFGSALGSAALSAFGSAFGSAVGFAAAGEDGEFSLRVPAGHYEARLLAPAGRAVVVPFSIAGEDVDLSDHGGRVLNS